MRLSRASLLGLFVLGAAGGLIGDQGHVASGTTAYLAPARSVPFIWQSPLWFPALVGLLTASLGELRLRLAGELRVARSSDGVAAVAAVLGLYAITALIRHQPLGPATVLVYALAAVIWRALGGNLPAVACGVVAAIVGVASEIALVQSGVFEYSHQIDRLAGVPPWLPALYFAFGVVVSRLAELCAHADVDTRTPRARSLLVSPRPRRLPVGRNDRARRQ
jgi:hypothetical protein